MDENKIFQSLCRQAIPHEQPTGQSAFNIRTPCHRAGSNFENSNRWAPNDQFLWLGVEHHVSRMPTNLNHFLLSFFQINFLSPYHRSSHRSQAFCSFRVVTVLLHPENLAFRNTRHITNQIYPTTPLVSLLTQRSTEVDTESQEGY